MGMKGSGNTRILMERAQNLIDGTISTADFIESVNENDVIGAVAGINGVAAVYPGLQA